MAAVGKPFVDILSVFQGRLFRDNPAFNLRGRWDSNPERKLRRIQALELSTVVKWQGVSTKK